MGGGDAAKRARRRDVDKAEVGEPWERVASCTIERALICQATHHATVASIAIRIKLSAARWIS